MAASHCPRRERLAQLTAMPPLGWIPNALTLSRCVFAGLVLVGALSAASVEASLASKASADEADSLRTLERLWHQFALFAFAAGAITDFTDGWAARMLNAQTRFGVWLDPIADKVLVGAALIGLCATYRSWLIAVPAALIIARDVFITWLRTRPEAGGVIAPSQLAKLKTALEMLAILVLMFPPAVFERPAEGSASAPQALLTGVVMILPLWIAAALSLASAAQYVGAIRDR